MRFDAAEPFLPELVGWQVVRQPGPSPTHGRYLVPRADAVVEYALWTDWDIQHLYELEHVWAHVTDAGELIHAEASWHGGHGSLVQDGRLVCRDVRPVAYAQPGKHAMAPDPGVFGGYDLVREHFTAPAERRAGNGGLIVTGLMQGRFATNTRRNMLANGYLRRHAFRPTFEFTRTWDALSVPWLSCDELVAAIPGRVEAQLARLEAERAKRNVWGVLFDIGDTLMIEATEQKDTEQTTQRADLWPGAAELVWSLRRQGYLLGLVADTRPGTYRNVLRQHGLYEAFDVFAISEELSCMKPDPRMFQHALDGLGLTEAEAPHVVMVGNNLARDVRGANALGIVSVWLHMNERYPLAPADDAERPRHEATSFAELAALLSRLG